MVTNSPANIPTGNSGTVLQGQGIGTANAFSTATYPSIATGTGTILRANGTNWLATTATYPNTTTINQILYSSANNTISEITTGNNGVLITSAGGVPSISSTLPAAVQANITSTGTITSGTWNGNTITVPFGGTGDTTLTAHGVLLGNGTSAINATATGSAGQVLQSGGAAADPTYSTATFPSTATSTGTILRANGTNWVATTATYPTTTTSQQILYSTAANTIGELTTGNSKVTATNSSGTLAMRDYKVVTQVFTSSGTYTPTTGMLYCVVECVGGGAGGGGAATTGTTTVSAGSGGGAGGYARKTVSAATIGASQSVTVGAKGTGGAAGNNNGTDGTASSLGAIVSASGGIKGIGSAAGSAAATLGGLGGAGSSGDFNTNGQPGGCGTGCANAGGGSCTIGGFGGSSYFCGGGIGSSNGAGNAATSYGGGGGGGSCYVSTTQVAGADGFAGIVIVTEYVIN